MTLFSKSGDTTKKLSTKPENLKLKSLLNLMEKANEDHRKLGKNISAHLGFCRERMHN